MGGRQRRRQAKAQALRRDIVKANAIALSKGRAEVGRVAQVNLSPDGLKASTHTGVRTPLHEGGAVKVIAHRGFDLGRPVSGRMFGKVAPPIKHRKWTAPKAKRFSIDGFE